MCLIFKDYRRPVVRISAININSLDLIQEWLDNIQIVDKGNKNRLSQKEQQI